MPHKLVGVLLLLMVFLVSHVASLECYTCDSTEDAECATKPGQQIEVEECLKATDECVTVVVSGVTRRGCLSRLYPNLYCPEPCDRCTTNLCNRNVFPADRLRCYQCVGSDCIDVSNKPQLLLPCPVYNENDRCYMNVLHISNVQRGCEYTNLPATCPHSCIKCNYNSCNNATGVYEHSCWECSHTTLSPDSSCLRQQDDTAGASSRCSVKTLKNCTNKLLYGDVGQCFTYVNEQTGVVNRGCTSTMGFYPTGNVTKCYGDNCNAECLDITCNTCTSDDDGQGTSNCRTGVNLKREKCSAGTFDCYSCESGSTVTRGCSNSSAIQDLLSSRASEPSACYSCRNVDGCNRNSVRSCHHCSSLTDVRCSEWSEGDGFVPPQQNCSHPAELCVTTLVSKVNLVYTVRGCADQVPECSTNDPYCIRCNASLCNTIPLKWHNNNLQADNWQQTEVQLRSEANRRSLSLQPLIIACLALWLWHLNTE